MTEQEIMTYMKGKEFEKNKALGFLIQKFDRLKPEYQNRHSLRKAEIEDAYIETIEALWVGLEKGSFTPPIEQIFRTILRNKCVEQYRKRAKNNLSMEIVDVPDAHPNILDELMDEETTKQATALFENLSEECKRLFRLWIEEGLSFREIAEKAGYKNDAHARKRKYHCWNNWKRLLKKESDGI